MSQVEGQLTLWSQFGERMIHFTGYRALNKTKFADTFNVFLPPSHRFSLLLLSNSVFYSINRHDNTAAVEPGKKGPSSSCISIVGHAAALTLNGKGKKEWRYLQLPVHHSRRKTEVFHEEIEGKKVLYVMTSKTSPLLCLT